MSGAPDYVIEAASDVGLVDEILRFYGTNPEPGIRRIDAAEARTLIESGRFVIARLGPGGPIVGAVYFSDQGLAAALPEYEIGGGLVKLEHRGSGLVHCMAASALVSFRMQVRRSSTDAGTDVVIVGRVAKSNKSPVRKVLRSLGFLKNTPKQLAAGSKPGLDEFPVGPNGTIEIDELEFDETQLEQRVREVMAWRDAGVLGPGKTVRIAIDALLAADGEDPLADFLRDLAP